MFAVRTRNRFGSRIRSAYTDAYLRKFSTHTVCTGIDIYKQKCFFTRRSLISPFVLNNSVLFSLFPIGWRIIDRQQTLYIGSVETQTNVNWKKRNTTKCNNTQSRQWQEIHKCSLSINKKKKENICEPRVSLQCFGKSVQKKTVFVLVRRSGKSKHQRPVSVDFPHLNCVSYTSIYKRKFWSFFWKRRKKGKYPKVNVLKLLYVCKSCVVKQQTSATNAVKKERNFKNNLWMCQQRNRIRSTTTTRKKYQVIDCWTHHRKLLATKQ